MYWPGFDANESGVEVQRPSTNGVAQACSTWLVEFLIDTLDIAATYALRPEKIEPRSTIPSSPGVNTSGGNTQNQKQLGDAIGNAVRAVIRQEQRQGGLLSK